MATCVQRCPEDFQVFLLDGPIVPHCTLLKRTSEILEDIPNNQLSHRETAVCKILPAFHHNSDDDAPHCCTAEL